MYLLLRHLHTRKTKNKEAIVVTAHAFHHSRDICGEIILSKHGREAANGFETCGVGATHKKRRSNVAVGEVRQCICGRLATN